MEIGAEEFQPLHHVDRVPVQWGSIFFPLFSAFSGFLASLDGILILQVQGFQGVWSLLRHD
jgi:hypothetical protein